VLSSCILPGLSRPTQSASQTQRFHQNLITTIPGIFKHTVRMDSSSWPQNFGNGSGGQTRTSYTTSSSSSNNNGALSSFEGFPSFKSLSQPSSFSKIESFSSDSTNSSKMFYLASVSNGHVLAHQENSRPSGVVVENKGDRGDEQKWTIEYGDDSNTVALKCAANGKYLHCFEGKSWGKVGTGDKQWWKISDADVTAPGACRIGPVDYPDVFLNHHSGNTVRIGAGGTKVHMYKWEVSVCSKSASTLTADRVTVAKQRTPYIMVPHRCLRKLQSISFKLFERRCLQSELRFEAQSS
jgi:hypothetical protein